MCGRKANDALSRTDVEIVTTSYTDDRARDRARATATARGRPVKRRDARRVHEVTTRERRGRGNRTRGPTAPRVFAWSVVASLVTICSVLSFSGASIRDALAFTRDGIAAGRLWPLATGHLVHLDASHAAVDIASLVLVAWIFSADLASSTEQVLVLAAGAVAVDAGLWFLHPEVARYVGLSGLLHAWFAAGVAVWIASVFDDPVDRRRVAWGVLLGIGLIVKLALEAGDRSIWAASFGWPVVTAAHRWGAAGGVLVGFALAWHRRRARA